MNKFGNGQLWGIVWNQQLQFKEKWHVLKDSNAELKRETLKSCFFPTTNKLKKEWKHMLWSKVINIKDQIKVALD